MTFAQAKRKLPKFAEGLTIHAVTVVALRDAVMLEIRDWKSGQNPLTDKQAAALWKFLKESAQ